MSTKFLKINFAALTLTALSSSLNSAWAQSVTVTEYYNKTLDAYFITGRANEQQTLDATADFQRTGMTFQAVAAIAATTATTRICRFYINVASPFTSSHFYGREGVDCESLRSQNLVGFSYEGYDFALAQPTSGVCPTNTTTIYRSFRAGANGKTSNHRYTASAETYATAALSGYAGEQAAFCATTATDITPLVIADCGTFYYPGVRVSYQSLTHTGTPNSWVRFNGTTKTLFNGKQATPVVQRYASGANDLILIDETADTWSDLGASIDTGVGMQDSYFNPPTLFPRRMAVAQQININRTTTFNPAQDFGTATEVGRVTFVSRESVDTPAGTYNACKFSTELTSTYPSVGRTVVLRATTWVAPNIGVVKSSTQESTQTGSAAAIDTATDVTAVAVQPL
ncbi:MAG: hypothetical protein H7203_11750 [Rhizobacter sp.]|nr:hypothetical protein [Burkholderiales bacterium]